MSLATGLRPRPVRTEAAPLREQSLNLKKIWGDREQTGHFLTLSWHRRKKCHVGRNGLEILSQHLERQLAQGEAQ